jgi:hypothetical protein
MGCLGCEDMIKKLCATVSCPSTIKERRPGNFHSNAEKKKEIQKPQLNGRKKKARKRTEQKVVGQRMDTIAESFQSRKVGLIQKQRNHDVVVKVCRGDLVQLHKKKTRRGAREERREKVWQDKKEAEAMTETN